MLTSTSYPRRAFSTPHALHTPGRIRYPQELAIPAEEFYLLIQQLMRKAPGTTSQMQGKVLRLLERGDQRTYYEWLQAQQAQGMYNMAQLETRRNGFLTLPMAVKRHRANQAREALGRQIIPWTFGLPRTDDSSTQGKHLLLGKGNSTTNEGSAHNGTSIRRLAPRACHPTPLVNIWSGRSHGMSSFKGMHCFTTN
jgi:hypothetical protein